MDNNLQKLNLSESQQSNVFDMYVITVGDKFLKEVYTVTDVFSNTFDLKGRFTASLFEAAHYSTDDLEDAKETAERIGGALKHCTITIE